MPTATDVQAAALADIIANPEDDTPRLIYADWLEDQGEAERATFIRLQIELTKPYTCPLSGGSDRCYLWVYGECPACQQRRHSTRRERELNTPERLASWLPAGMGVFSFLSVFRRGFVAEVTCHCEDWCGRVCERCQGSGDDRGYALSHSFHRCPDCHGVGRVGAHGPALVRACPLEEVRLSGKEPDHIQGGVGNLAGFWWEPGICYEGHHQIPFALAEAAGWEASFISGLMVYKFSSKADALAAISQACLAWARGQEPARA